MAVKPLTIGWIAAAALTVAPHVRAQEAGLQPLASVQLAAERALRRELDPAVTGIELTAVSLDPRLRLSACATALDARAQPPHGTQTRVLARVACNSGAIWSVNVPVDIRREVPLLVLRRAVPRGEIIAASDVAAQKRVIAGLVSPFVSRPEDLAGRLTRRPLPEGTAVTADALGAALLIHRGQDVTLKSETGGIEVRAPGRALADASASQRVRVQNLASLKVIEGVAESDAVVRVTP